MANILLLDDDPIFRGVVTTCLSGRHTVVEVSRCKDAEAQVQKRTFDLLLVDGLLPDGYGIQWIEKFRERNAVTPVLFISSFWKSEAGIKKIPNMGVLHKPILPNDLMSKVENALRSSGCATTLSADALQELAEMRTDYARDLPNQIQGVHSALAELRRSPGNAAVRGIARRRAHIIAGSAGSFGFDDVGDACANIEQAILTFGEGEPQAWEKIEKAMARLPGARPAAQGAEARV